MNFLYYSMLFVSKLLLTGFLTTGLKPLIKLSKWPLRTCRLLLLLLYTTTTRLDSDKGHVVEHPHLYIDFSMRMIWQLGIYDKIMPSVKYKAGTKHTFINSCQKPCNINWKGWLAFSFSEKNGVFDMHSY